MRLRKPTLTVDMKMRSGKARKLSMNGSGNMKTRNARGKESALSHFQPSIQSTAEPTIAMSAA